MMSPMPTATFTVTAFYHFFPIKETEALRSEIYDKAQAYGLRGLILVAEEGLNGTIGGLPEKVKLFKNYLATINPAITFKDSPAGTNPCKRLYVKVRPEIVQLGDPEIVPEGPNNHLSPEEWNKMIKEEDVVVLDTRNAYETEIGKFKGALDPKLAKFSDFPTWVKDCGISKKKAILMYCTGGIRCEKASLEMQRQGYENVYQLDGGILRYLKECPNDLYEGECFVFDHRASVDQNLNPSDRYKLCPHCGDPGDQIVSCDRCEKECTVCAKCLKKDAKTKACSKNCANIMRGLIGKCK